MISHPARAQTPVANDEQYLNALQTSPHILITQPIPLFSSLASSALPTFLEGDGVQSSLGGMLGTQGRAWTGDTLGGIKGVGFTGFEGWESTLGGGAVYVQNDVLQGMDDVQFVFNQHDTTFDKLNFFGRGGALYVGGDFHGDLRNARFAANYAFMAGGGFYVAGDFNGAIRGSTFTGNRTAVYRGGGFSIENILRDGIHDSTFRNNSVATWESTGAESGGGFYVQYLRGGIHNSIFEQNHGGTSGGGFAVSLLDDPIRNSIFTANRAVNGAAIHAFHLFSSIQNTRFVGNRALAGSGGAINATAIFQQYPIENSLFIDNTAQGDASWFTWGQGGALAVAHAVRIRGSVFLRNAAGTLNAFGQDRGWGGALFLHNSTSINGEVFVEASPDHPVLFYGNTHNPQASGVAPNAIHFANRSATNAYRQGRLTVSSDSGARVLMLDPLSAQGSLTRQDGTAYGTLATNIIKNGAGDWFLGGVNDMRGASTWDLNQGALHLVTTDYGAGIGVQNAAIHLKDAVISRFTLDANAMLGGSGTVQAKDMTLHGVLSPGKWVNTGTLAHDLVGKSQDIIDEETASVMNDAAIAAADKIATINARAPENPATGGCEHGCGRWRLRFRQADL